MNTKPLKALMLLLFITIAAGCGQSSPDSVTISSTSHSLMKETIAKDPSTDLFLLQDRVYVRVGEMGNKAVQFGESLGKIESNYTVGADLREGMSTKLPVGTEIFRLQGEESVDEVLTEQNGDTVIYRALAEG